MKLTAPQNTALRLIHEKPGQVAARINGQPGNWIGFRTLHPRPEARLVELGLVETTTTTTSRTGEHEVPVLALTPTGYAALGIEPPASDEQDKAEQHPEDEIPLPLPERFRRTYEAELGEIHGDSDSAPYRRVWDHVMNNRPTAPRWLLGHLADVAALLVDLVYETQETTPAARAACRRGCTELLDTLSRHGVRAWPVFGHTVRPWDGPAHCDDCAERAGHRPPESVLAAEAAYEAKLAAELLNAEEQIADQYGEHMRTGAGALYTGPDGKSVVAIVRSVYWRGDKAAADVVLITGKTGSVTADQLAPLPELPDMGEPVEGRWLITGKTGDELARVSADSRAEALDHARRIPAVREAEHRDGGLAARPLWTADLAASSA